MAFEQFGEYSGAVADAYLQILGRGGKRIRGALTMVGYEMCGGTNKKMILEAALVIEMVHAYLLIVDDFQDRSLSRRGGPSAHEALGSYHEHQGFTGDSQHIGAALAWNAALFGSHAAQRTLANIDAPAQLKLNAISILNNSLIVTAHGQTNDIINEVRGGVTEKDIENVMLWKAAYYTFLNPLHTGMVLAGADCTHTDAITAYAHKAGLVFQITDDILGISSAASTSGKSPLDDIKEGKRTLLSTYALKHANKAEVKFLNKMLGNQDLTQTEFARCKEILKSSGAIAYAKQRAEQLAKEAIVELRAHAQLWDEQAVDFLEQLVLYLLKRTA